MLNEDVKKSPIDHEFHFFLVAVTTKMAHLSVNRRTDTHIQTDARTGKTVPSFRVWAGKNVAVIIHPPMKLVD